MAGLLGRSTAIWFAILLVAIANGALREGVLVPGLGSGTAHVISTLLLSGAVFAVTLLTISWIGVGSAVDAWTIGIYWLLLTVAFEFLGGHYLFGRPWEVLLADYRLQDGRIWVLVLISTLLSPLAALRLS